MTTNPDVPHRLEFTFELPGTPEQVWEAIATGPGISSWFLRTDVEERLGGALITHMGDTSSPGRITAWEPNRRLAYEEPEWPSLAGHEGAAVTPLASEFLIEAQSGGTCVLRVVTSAFGTGADWEDEFFEGLRDGWLPYFDRLRLYLAHFPGQRATALEASHVVPNTDPHRLLAALRDALGIGDDSETGQPVEARDTKGQLEQVGDLGVLLRITDPVPGLLGFSVYEAPGGAQAMVHGHLFSDAAPAYVEREWPGWQSWLEQAIDPS